MRRRPSASMIVAVLALVVALGGASYAAFKLPKNSVRTKSIKNGAVTLPKIRSQAQAALNGVVGVPFSSGLVGPLPTASKFTKARSGSDLLINFSGTGFAATSNSLGRLAVSVDGKEVGYTKLFFSNTVQHLALPAAELVVKGLPAGAHSLALSAEGMSTDANDRFKVTVLELQPAG